jgi:BirA family biotin operon repressor/biotin-[acetyl-CoA-carboxylase] ligase
LAIRIFFSTGDYLAPMAVPDANPSTEHWPTGWHVHHVQETGSTNADLVELARAGAVHHSVIVADHQTAGRGRLDRKWEAPPGANLLVSILFKPSLFRPLHHFTHIVGLAARNASNNLFEVRPDLKWPNDLLIGDRKVAGILAQGGTDFVVVGIGVNVGWAPDGAARLGDQARGSNIELGPLDLLREMLAEVERLESLSNIELRALYESQLATIGRRVRVELANGVIVEGTAIGIDDEARLTVRLESGETISVDVGDVIHLRA